MSSHFYNVSIAKHAHIYSDGKCISYNLTFPDNTKKTVGVILPATLSFGTDAAETMEMAGVMTPSPSRAPTPTATTTRKTACVRVASMNRWRQSRWAEVDGSQARPASASAGVGARALPPSSRPATAPLEGTVGRGDRSVADRDGGGALPPPGPPTGADDRTRSGPWRRRRLEDTRAKLGARKVGEGFRTGPRR